MPEKLLTLQELSEYLSISEEKITSLVEGKVISAYRIGGELLRFRKDQIDAIRAEIDSRVGDADRTVAPEPRGRIKEKLEISDVRGRNDSFLDRTADFFYFNDFYIFSGVLVTVLLIIIFRG